MRNLWIMPATRHKTSHPTEKPETLLERIILLGSKPNDTVLDPFMGSGTTGVIAKRLGRNFIGIEIDDSFFNIAEKRISKTRVEKSLFAVSEPSSKSKSLRLYSPQKLCT